MAVNKKFFVDINLQGNALQNATIGTNSDMTKSGSFQYNSTSNRLEYYDGSNIQEVADLSDISAVTGGLIFQTGVDCSTNPVTPNIADGTADKGFFWVVTVAGTFLGESVQVGDSIIAKVDNAGSTLTDWLILQGNVVIATDTVDGIVRLATQTEVNTGTEGGAVVVTPATLQGKIDAQITPEINNKLPLAGGTMSGNIDMGGYSINNSGAIYTNNLLSSLNTEIILANDLRSSAGAKITNLPAPTNGGDATNKDYVDQAVVQAVDSLAYTAIIANGDWTLNAGVYEYTITHNLGSYVTFTAFYGGENVDFGAVSANNTLTLYSNINPSLETVVTIYANL